MKGLKEKFLTMLEENEEPIYYIMKTLSVTGLVIIVVGILFSSFAAFSGFIPIGLAGLMYVTNWHDIPSEPPSVGIRKVWGKRTHKIKGEGRQKEANYWPLYVTYLDVNVEKKNITWTFPNIRCKAEGDTSSQQGGEAGGEISVVVSATFIPDFTKGERLNQYINSGNEKGVTEIMQRMQEEDVRQTGSEKTWQEVEFGRDELTRKLILKLTGQPMPEGEQALKEFNEDFRKNGFPDIASLGMILTRLNIGKIDESESLKKATDNQEKERQERHSEGYELATEILLATQMFEGQPEDAVPKMTFKDCLLEVRRRKTMREGQGTVIDFPGVEKILSAASSLLQGGQQNG